MEAVKDKEKADADFQGGLFPLDPGGKGGQAVNGGIGPECIGAGDSQGRDKAGDQPLEKGPAHAEHADGAHGGGGQKADNKGVE